MIIGFLWNVLKALLIIVGIMLLISIMIELILIPFKVKKEKELKRQFTDALNEIANQCIEELQKQENSKKKSARKPKNLKKNEEN